ncbi:MAG: ABC transporter permease, partial [Blastocatellia bacterium]
AIFSVVYGVLLRPLPIKDPDRVMRLNETFLPSGWGTASAANFRDWRVRNTVFEHLSAYEFQNFNLESEDSPVRVPGASVTADYLDTMGVQPELGRAFLPGEDTAGREHVALIGDKTWRSQFMADGHIVGRTIKLGGESYTIIGVMPEGFFFPSQLSQIWTPLVFTKEQLEHRGSHMFFVVGRMKRDVTAGQAASQMKGIARQIELQYPDLQAGRSVRITQLKDDMVVRAKPALLVLLGAVAAVLLICCVNVASLMLTNAASRRKETAVRAALGAGRWRLTRQFLTESVILSLLGGALGAAIAKPALSSLLALASTYLPRSKEVGLDLGVLGFTLGLSLVTGIVFGTVPAFQASRADVRDALTDGTRSVAGSASNRLRQGLVVAEIALSLALLIGAGLLIKSFNRLQQVSSGLNPDNVMTMQLSLPESHYLTDELKVAFFKQALAKIEAAPGIGSAGTINLLPMQEWGYNGEFGIEGRPADAPGSEPSAEWRAVSSDYFRTLGIPVLEGRGFGNQDAANTPIVVIIDHALAERYFSGVDPVGKTLIVGASHARVVGIVGDVRQSGLSEPGRPTLFLSYDQSPMDDGAGDVSLVVRGKTDPAQLVSTVREQILSIDRAQPVYNVKSMSQV